MPEFPDAQPDRIEFLIQRKFSDQLILLNAFSALQGKSLLRLIDEDPKTSREVCAYRKHLASLSSEALSKLYKEESAAAAKERGEKNAAAEARLFFHSLDSGADYPHWCRASYWSLDEAIALSFGKEPKRVSWKKVEPFLTPWAVPQPGLKDRYEYRGPSPFAEKYARLRDLVLRAREMGQLYEKVLPGFYIAWTQRNQIELPNELVSGVAAFGHQIADWKTQYDEQIRIRSAEQEHAKEQLQTVRGWAKQQADEAIAWAKGQVDEAAATTTDLRAQIEALNQQLTASTATAARSPELKPLSAKERESLLRLTIGMAIHGYGFDPQKSRSETAKEIAADLHLCGVSLDVDTVRKYLHEGAELLPGDVTDQKPR